MNIITRRKHGNTPQKILQRNGGTMPQQFTAQHHQPPANFDPDKSIYNIEYVWPDGTIVLGEITGGQVTQEQPLPVLRLFDQSPRVYTGETAVRWYRDNREYLKTTTMKWDHIRVTEYIPAGDLWAGKWPEPHWFTLVERHPGKPPIYISYVVAKIGADDHRIVNYWRVDGAEVSQDQTGAPVGKVVFTGTEHFAIEHG